MQTHCSSSFVQHMVLFTVERGKSNPFCESKQSCKEVLFDCPERTFAENELERLYAKTAFE